MRHAGLAIIVSILTAAPGCAANRSPMADVILTLEFPDVGLTLDTMAGWSQRPAHATVYLPKDYTTERPFPALLFIGSSTGGDGRNIGEARRIADAAGGGFVAINLPIFVRDVPPLAPDWSNRWQRLDIEDDDGDTMWKAYQVMLTRVRKIVPNLDPERSVMGGFSNGAHATAVLLNRDPAEIRQWFGRFVFIEGGERFTRFVSLNGSPIAIVQGAAQSQHLQRPLYDGAVAAGIKAEWILLEDVGHELTDRGIERVGAWIKRHR